MPLERKLLISSLFLLVALVSLLLGIGIRATKELHKTREPEVTKRYPKPALPTSQEEPTAENASRIKSLPVSSPSEVKAIYATSYTALHSGRIHELIDLIDTTELNALVINVKESSGRIELGKDMAVLVKRLKEKNIYPIARVVVFQDSALARNRSDLALKDKNGGFWHDSGGQLWVDPASSEVWAHNAEIAMKAIELGFREINFDYIRFPSDGDLETITYPAYDGTTEKDKAMNLFFEYLASRIHKTYPKAVLSADIFADGLLRDTDLGVGQRFVTLVDYFNVASPMTYPSHYLPYNFGFPNPAEEPYQVVFQTLESGKKALEAVGKKAVIRPWIQAFDIGAIYDARMVKEEIRAISDAGFHNGWMIWNPDNVYEKEAFLPE